MYDQETGFYYLQSRYYDPAVARFLNADSYVSTGNSVIGNNMYAYCDNNPVNRSDPSGLLWQGLKEFWQYFAPTLQESSGYFATALGVSQVDSVLPGPADIISAGMLVAGVLRCAAKATQTYYATTNKSKSLAIAKAESTTKKAKQPVIFPENPNDFNPVGLVKVVRAGSKNGILISWMDITSPKQVAVFRWDENPNFPNGPHYHINGQNTHYYAGNAVPEPFASLYFPNQK